MIKYIGKKHLNSNLYKQITLKKEDDYVKVRAVEDKRFKNTATMKLDTATISDQIQNSDEYEKIKEIVSYFLRNNTIWKLVQQPDKIIVMSTSDRKLVLELDKEYQDLLPMIIQKYENDRLQFMDENKINKVHIRAACINDDPIQFVSNESSYFIGRNKDTLEESLVLTVLMNGQKIAPFDKQFLLGYIKEIMNKCTKEINYYTDYNINIHRYALMIMCYYYGRYHHISLDRNLRDEIIDIILQRNCEIREQNDKQLKLKLKWEGIK